MDCDCRYQNIKQKMSNTCKWSHWNFQSNSTFELTRKNAESFTGNPQVTSLNVPWASRRETQQYFGTKKVLVTGVHIDVL